MTFVTVNYGDNKQLLVNPNCQTRLLLENIKTRCQFPQEMEVELSDEFGNLKNITQGDIKYANQILNVDRESLVLIQVKRNNGNSDILSNSLASSFSNLDEISYVPLLKNDDIVTAKFTARLTSRDAPPSRSESRTRKSYRDRKEKSSRRATETKSSIDKTDGSSSSPTASSKRNGSSKKRLSTPTRSKSRGKQRS
ncbi:uncharacterized protein CXorf65-like [Clavelina lepadiformis]|uniref:Ubiquitin-like domain-containing protein n=1 Tax=Clavelina lepadiformis TaxID=159417 RepID=A0ABP0GSF2_CLALP